MWTRTHNNHHTQHSQHCEMYLIDKTLITKALFCCDLLLLRLLLHVHLVALLTGNGKSNNQRNKLLKVHLPISVGVQVLHDLVHSSRVLLRLEASTRQLWVMIRSVMNISA